MSRQDDIRRAAAQLFHERGFAAVGVDDIGRAAGVTGPAIYRHFGSKDEILASLFDEGMDEILRLTGGTFDDPFEELEHLVREHARHLMSDTVLASVWTREDRSLVDPFRRQFRRRARKYFGRWTACVSACYPESPDDEISAAVHATIGALNSIPGWPAGTLRHDDVLEFLVQANLSAFAVLGTRAAR